MQELRDIELGEKSPGNERLGLASGISGGSDEQIFLDVTIWKSRTWLGDLAVAWSLFPIPWLTLILALADFRQFWIFVTIVTGLAVLLNETVLKPVIKQPRPGALHRSYGMPSGHSLCAGLLLTLLGQGWASGKVLGTSWVWGWVVLPVLYLPVPWARWLNLDHTWQQCLAGFTLGLAFGLIFYPVCNLF